MSGSRLELLSKDAPIGTRVLVLTEGAPHVDYTRSLPYEDPIYGWFVSIGRSILDSSYGRLEHVYALPNSALEQKT
jgi:hypothetical protein